MLTLGEERELSEVFQGSEDDVLFRAVQTAYHRQSKLARGTERMRNCRS